MLKSNFYKKIVITILMIATVISADFANIFVNTAQAAINEEINYQGKLTNASNVAVADGLYTMEFSLYTALTGGSPIWTETLNGVNEVQVTNGIFSVMLGSTTPFTGVNFNQTLYLGVKIEADSEMTPRKIIGTVPAAFIANTANALEGLSSSQFLRSDAQNATSSTNTFLNVLQTGTGKIAEFFGNVSQSVLAILSNGNVGIGTSSPYAALSVVGVTGVVADHYTSTSTKNASVFPYASTTALTIAGRVYTSDATVSNTITLANLNGPLQAVNGLVSATSTISPAFGGTGVSTLPSFGNILVGQSNGSYVLTATSSLGLSSFAYPFTISTNYGVNNQATTGIAWFQNGLNASSTSNFVYASTTALSATTICITGDICRTSWPSSSGGAFPFTPTTFGSTNANSTSTLIGFTNGIYSLASSTIGAGGQTTGLTVSGGATTTGNAYFAGNVGIGTTSPFATLSIQGQTAQSGDAIPGLAVYGGAGKSNGGTDGTIGGKIILVGGQGGGSGVGTGGAGGVAEIYGGTGGSSAEVGGNGANVYIAGGIAGAGSTPGSVAGNLILAMNSSGVDIGNVGIGTTSPNWKLSVSGMGFFGDNVISSYFNATSTTRASTFPYASTTALSATTICITTDCRTSWPTASGGGYDFTPATNYGVANQATTGIAWFQNGLNASSTSHFNNNITLDTNGLTVGRASVAGYPLLVAANGNNIQFDTFTNFYLAGQGTGSAVQLQNANGDLLITNGVAGGAKLRFTAASGDVYLENTAAGALIFRNGVTAVERLKIATNGNVGIGTTTPGQKLSVAGDILGNNLIGTYFTSTSTSLASTFPYASTTALSATTLCLIGDTCITSWPTSSGGGLGWASTTLPDTNSIYTTALYNVGIGTTSPYAKLSVHGSALSQYTKTLFAISSSTAAYATSTIFAVTADKKVGIGTTTPFATLAVHGTTMTGGMAVYPAFAVYGGDGIDTGQGIILKAGAGQTYGGSVELTAGDFSLSDGNGGDILIKAGLGGSQDGQAGNVYIDAGIAGGTGTNGAILLSTVRSGANVGIGTTSPYAKLSVVGEILGTYFTSTSTTRASTFPYASTTALSATTLCISTDCKTAWPSAGGGVYPFTPATNYGVNNQATTGIVWFQNGLNASSTSNFAYASTTAISATTICITGDTCRTTWPTSSGGGGLGWASTTSPNSDSIFSTALSNVGIGTTSPNWKLSVSGMGYFGDNVISSYFTATSSTATSTFAGGMNIGSGNLVYDYYTGVTSITSAEFGNLNFDTDAGAIAWVDMEVTTASVLNMVESYTAMLDGSPMLTIFGKSNGQGGIIASSTGVGIGTTTPLAMLDIFTGSSTPFSTGHMSNYNAVAITNQATSSFASVIKTGLNIVSTGPWSGSGSSNIGLYVSSVTGGTNNFDAIFNGGGNVGIGTTSPYTRLSVVGETLSTYFTSTSTTRASTFPYASTTALSATTICLTGDTCRTTWPTGGGGGLGWASTTAPDTNSIFSSALSNVGIGTTSPYAKLSVVGEIVTSYLTSTTTATSTFGGSIAVTEVNATSTFAGGINITDGCFAIDGVCVAGAQGPQGPAGAGVEGVIVTTFVADGTWTKADYTNLSFTEVITTAGGGGGGGADSDGSAETGAGGGGAGGTALEMISAASLGTTETVLVSTTGGTGGTGNGAGGNGTAGGDASFGAHNSATGGNGGTGTTVSGTTCTNADVGPGGAGAAATGGDINLTGGAGTGPVHCIAESVMGGVGGASYWGGGGAGGVAEAANACSAGGSGTYGSGGGGAVCEDSTAGADGGAGVDGIVVTMNYTSGAADLAEWYETKEDVEAGDVVAISSDIIEYNTKIGLDNTSILEKAITNSNVVGVISTAPYKTMGADVLGSAKHPRAVALAGRVPVKVTEQNGKIRAGDLLTISPVPGHAMLSKKAGVTIGRALEDSSCVDGEVCKVMIMVHTSYSTGALLKSAYQLAGLDISVIPGNNNIARDISKAILAEMIQDKKDMMASTSISEVFTDRVVAGLEVITPTLYADDVFTNRLSGVNDDGLQLEFGGNGITFSDKAKLNNSTSTSSPVITFDTLGNAIFAGEIRADKVIGNNIIGLEVIAGKFSNLTTEVSSLIASNSASSTSQYENILQNIANLIATSTAVESRLTTLENVKPFDINELLATSTETIFAGAVVMNGSLTINSIGSGTSTLSLLNDVEFFGTPYFTTDTAGFAIVKKGSKKVSVVFDREYLAQPIVNTSISLDAASSTEQESALAEEVFSQDIKFVVTGKNKKGFTILLNKAVKSDLQFSWTAFAVKGARTFESTEFESEPEQSPVSSPSPSSVTSPVSIPVTSAVIDVVIGTSSDPVSTSTESVVEAVTEAIPSSSPSPTPEPEQSVSEPVTPEPAPSPESTPVESTPEPEQSEPAPVATESAPEETTPEPAPVTEPAPVAPEPATP